jgi:hypothetical protein
MNSLSLLEAAISEALGRFFTPRSILDLQIWTEPRHPCKVGSVLAQETIGIPESLLAETPVDPALEPVPA